MEKNLDEAVKWLRKAAELGHKDAITVALFGTFRTKIRKWKKIAL